jgi:predicted small metal-binding protein
MTSDRDDKPKVTPQSANADGRINPSSPTAGTEGYGMHPGESGGHHAAPEASHPDAEGAGDIRKTAYPQSEGSELMENKSREEELRDNPNNRMGKMSFSCRDAGNTACNWSAVGDNESDVMRQVEQHARDAHGVTNFDDNSRKRVHDAMRNRAA